MERRLRRALACQDGFVGFELLPPHVEAAVGEARALPQVAQVVRQLTLGHLQHVHVGLARDVDRVLHHAHLEAGRERERMSGRKERRRNREIEGDTHTHTHTRVRWDEEIVWVHTAHITSRVPFKIRFKTVC